MRLTTKSKLFIIVASAFLVALPLAILSIKLILPVLWPFIELDSISRTGRTIEENSAFKENLEIQRLEKLKLENEGTTILNNIKNAMPMELDGYYRVRPIGPEPTGEKYHNRVREIRVDYHFRRHDGSNNIFAELVISADSRIDAYAIPNKAVSLGQGPWKYAWSHQVYNWNDQLWPQDKRNNYGKALISDYYFGNWSIQKILQESRQLLTTCEIANELRRWKSQWITESGLPIYSSSGRCVWPSSPKNNKPIPNNHPPFPNWGEPKPTDLPQHFQVEYTERCRPESVNPKCVYLRIIGSEKADISLLTGRINFNILNSMASTEFNH